MASSRFGVISIEKAWFNLDAPRVYQFTQHTGNVVNLKVVGFGQPIGGVPAQGIVGVPAFGNHNTFNAQFSGTFQHAV
jgi:hypothetical protein